MALMSFPQGRGSGPPRSTSDATNGTSSSLSNAKTDSIKSKQSEKRPSGVLAPFSSSGFVSWLRRYKIILIIIMILACVAAIIIPVILTVGVKGAPVSSNPSTPVNNTIELPGVLQTWWHNTGEINYRTVVEPGNVRQSHMYRISISTDGNNYFDSFTYETIPRNGQGNIVIPGNLSSTTDDVDSITIEQDLNMTMAWTSFLYGQDVLVKIHRLDGTKVTPGNITIRPTTLGYTISQVGDDIAVKVPYSSAGTRFSLEFLDNLYQYHLNTTAPIADFVQDQNPSGYGYVESYTSDMPIIGVEPHDALLIFANAFPSADLIPSNNDVYKVPEGLVTGLDKITASTVVFEPGVYWCTGTAVANLSSAVDWVYFAPGSYVKGAVWFNSESENIKATGPGVLSGEQYVYQANTQDGYKNTKSDDYSVRMWSGNVNSDASNVTTFTLNGPTVNAPPFNSMDFRGDVNYLTVRASNYKQVGAFFGQTDGIEAYPGSVISDVFYHSNDDTIKTYYSHVRISDVIVWKGRTAPTIQFGWSSRNVTDIEVSGVSIIHSKYNQNDTHPAIIGSDQVYQEDDSDVMTANVSNWITDVSFSNIRSEGLSPNLFRIVPLANFRNFNISNVFIEQMLPSGTAMDTSELPMWYDANGTAVSIENFAVQGLHIGDEIVTYAGNNWMTGQTGSMNINSTFMHPGNVTIVY